MCRPEEYVFSELSAAALDRAQAIESACFTNPWSADDFRQVTRDGRALCLGLWVAQELVGYAVGYVEGTRLHLANLAVDSARQRQGWGGLLLRQILARAGGCGCRVCALEVRASNTAALQLYRQHGFAQVARHPGYYTCPVESAVVMRRELAGARASAGQTAVDCSAE